MTVQPPVGPTAATSSAWWDQPIYQAVFTEYGVDTEGFNLSENYHFLV